MQKSFDEEVLSYCFFFAYLFGCLCAALNWFRLPRKARNGAKNKGLENFLPVLR